MKQKDVKIRHLSSFVNATFFFHFLIMQPKVLSIIVILFQSIFIYSKSQTKFTQIYSFLKLSCECHMF